MPSPTLVIYTLCPGSLTNVIMMNRPVLLQARASTAVWDRIRAPAPSLDPRTSCWQAWGRERDMTIQVPEEEAGRPWEQRGSGEQPPWSWASLLNREEEL